MFLFYYKDEKTARLQEFADSEVSTIPDIEGVTIETTDKRILLKDVATKKLVADINIDNYDIYYFESK